MNFGTITRRLNRVMYDLNDELQSYAYTRKAFDDKLKGLELVLQTPCMTSRAPSVWAELYRMLDAAGIDYDKAQPLEYYRRLIDSSDLPDADAFEQHMFRFMYDNFDRYPTPEDYMRRLVDRLSNAADGWKDRSLRLRILNQFIRYGNYLKDAGFGGHLEIKKYVKDKLNRAPTNDEVCAHLDDNIFDRLNGASKAQKKPEGKFGLLKLADDLAGGKFRSGGATKRGLYLFAMVYGMTYSDSDDDRDTNVETNLFWDYYSDNLMRFITDAYRKGTTDFEAAPSGRGINFKNFAEMICLYFIKRDCPPRDKIKLSARMIREVQAEYVGGGAPIGNDTRFYVGRNKLGNVFDKPPEQFKRFILDNYDCSTRVEDPRSGRLYSIGAMQAQSDQHNAKLAQQELVRRLAKMMPLDACNYGLWFTDVRKLDPNSVDDRAKFDDFNLILRDIDSLLKDERLFAPQNVNRTALLVIWYYYYNESHNGDNGAPRLNFVEHFERFKRGVDIWLERASYQPLNVKNIFDIAVAFSSYAYLSL